MLENKMIYLKINDSGFTLVELVIIVCILGILISIASPLFSTWLPDYRLRCKAKELYGDMYLARMNAIKENSKYKIFFFTGSSESYILKNADGSIEKTVELKSSNSDQKIGFGGGAATKSAKKSGGALPDDGVSFYNNVVTFNSRGTGSPGYVYIDNSKGSSYAVGMLSSGVIFLKKWDMASSSWK